MRLPILQQLFADNDTNIRQTDIVMLLTPRIVRSHQLTANDLEPDLHRHPGQHGRRRPAADLRRRRRGRRGARARASAAAGARLGSARGAGAAGRADGAAGAARQLALPG